MTPDAARRKSLTSVTKTVAGLKVWPVAYGHVLWLRDTRKNKILTRGDADDFSVAEICFAFTQDPLALQSITGAKATKAVNDMLLSGSISDLNKLFEHATEQLTIYAKTLPVAKKTPAAPRRANAARSRRKR